MREGRVDSEEEGGQAPIRSQKIKKKLKQKFETNLITEPKQETKETANENMVEWKPFKYEP